MDKKFTKRYIAIIRCRKCGEEVELEANRTEALLGSPSIRYSKHMCPKRLSYSEFTLFDLVSIRHNENYSI